MTEVKEIMNKPITVDKGTSIGEAISIMLKEQISHVLISENNNISEIVSEKDICHYLLNRSNESINKIPIREISKSIISIDSKSNIKSCAELMVVKGIGSLGIKTDQVVGIITKTDILKIIKNEMKGKQSAVEIMSDEYLWEFSDQPINKIFKKMNNFNISRLILKERNEIASGIITIRDLLKLGFSDYDTNSIHKSQLDTDLLFHRFNSSEVIGEKISTKKIISVSMNEDISKICSLLLNKEINGLGVLNNNNIIWGILTKTDILKAFINEK